MVALDHALGILRDAGFPPRDAVLANHALGNYVAGAACGRPWGWPARAARTGDAGPTTRLGPGRLPPDVAPNVTWAAGGCLRTLDDRFEFGLEVVLDGLEARLTAVDPDETPS